METDVVSARQRPSPPSFLGDSREDLKRETPYPNGRNQEVAGQLGEQRGAAIVTSPSTRPVAWQRGGGTRRTWASAGLRRAGGGGRRRPHRLFSSQAMCSAPGPALPRRRVAAESLGHECCLTQHASLLQSGCRTFSSSSGSCRHLEISNRRFCQIQQEASANI